MGAREFFKQEQTNIQHNNSLGEFKRQRGLCCPLFSIGLIGGDDIKQLPSFITTNAA